MRTNNKEKIMLTNDQKEAFIQQIAQFPARVAELVRDLSTEQLTTMYLPGEWTIAQNVHHLVDSHMNSYVRCKLIATEHNPPLKPYDEHAWAQFPDASTADLSASLALLANLHVRWVMFWRSLPDDAWQRTGVHAVDGTLTLEQQLQNYVAHGRAHLEQIGRVRAAMRKE
jgi:hypothetical protein